MIEMFVCLLHRFNRFKADIPIEITTEYLFIAGETTMSTPIHMRDQVKDRIQTIMQEGHSMSFDDYAQLAAMILIVFIFLTFGLYW